MLRDLVEAGTTSIRISLDIISPKKFREVKGTDLAERVLVNLDACVDLIRVERLPVTLVILCVNPESEDVVIQYRKLFNWVGSINRISDGGKYHRPVPCEQPFYLLMIHSDGDVSMCCADTMKELIVGNIRQAVSLRDILASEALRIKRKGFLEQCYKEIPACGYCEVYSVVDDSLFEEREELLKFLSI